MSASPSVVMVTGAAGQDGRLLVRRLMADGCSVHALVRPATRREGLLGIPGASRRLTIHDVDLVDAALLTETIARTGPTELYNLAGLSSVSASFRDPWTTWETNARAVWVMLEAIRSSSPGTRFYQASSSEMFGGLPGESHVHDETSALRPQSPYAAAKASAHLACRMYRDAFGLRVACGIAFNHESSGRPASFLTRKVVDHVRALRAAGRAQGARPPLRMGNLAARRDWGYAPDYVEGMIMIARQIEVRARVRGGSPEADVGSSYRDYVLATGRLHAVWELVDRAFALGDFELDWDRDSKDPSDWHARFRDTRQPAVIVDRSMLRPSDPIAIGADPTRALTQLGWSPRVGLDTFLAEMLSDDARA